MKHIDNIADYPNMLPDEIIQYGYSLSGDALELFMKISTELEQDKKADAAIADFAEYLDGLTVSINTKKEELWT